MNSEQPPCTDQQMLAADWKPCRFPHPCWRCLRKIVASLAQTNGFDRVAAAYQEVVISQGRSLEARMQYVLHTAHPQPPSMQTLEWVLANDDRYVNGAHADRMKLTLEQWVEWVTGGWRYMKVPS